MHTLDGKTLETLFSRPCLTDSIRSNMRLLVMSAQVIVCLRSAAIIPSPILSCVHTQRFILSSTFFTLMRMATSTRTLKEVAFRMHVHLQESWKKDLQPDSSR